MNILIAPSNFKESISAEDAARAVELGINALSPEIHTICLPLSDGGEGFVDALVNAADGSRISCQVRDPLGRIVDSYYGHINEETAVIEMALASGLERLANSERNPWITSTYGTGQLIHDAIVKGYRKIIMGIGGSATNDVGMGMLQALGIKFYDRSSKLIRDYGAQYLNHVHSIDPGVFNRIARKVAFTVACDVTNPLLGLHGATHVYGPQKGADHNQLKTLERAVLHFHEQTLQELKVDKSACPGAGAAGGLGYAMMTYMGAEMKPGFDIVSEFTSLEERIKWSDLIITGEGKIDNQTAQGKVVSRLANLTKRHSKPLIVIGGVVEKATLIDRVEEYYAIQDRAKDKSDSMQNAADYLFQIALEIANKLKK